jgi:hypothetical protein
MFGAMFAKKRFVEYCDKVRGTVPTERLLEREAKARRHT